MKKSFFIISLFFIISSCGGSDPKPIEATYGPVGVDSSQILPPLIDTTLNNPKTLHGADSGMPVE